MSDIFISYAKEDREWVISLADALRQQGWTVWWDRSIPFGQSFQEVIERELNDAQCAIVVWSRHSVGSGWVSAEADEARNRNILVPVLIDGASPPLVFRQLQTADLESWNGDTASPVFKKLIADIGSLLGQSEFPVSQSRFSSPGSPEPAPATVQKNPPRWTWFAGLAAMFVVAAIWFLNLQEPAPTQAPVINEFRVDSPRIKIGDRLNLIWNTSNASSVEIRELGEVAHSGSSRIRPDTTTVYTLIARNSEGESTQETVEVIVEEQQVEERAEETPDPQQLISLFNESLEAERLDLAEQFLEKAIKITPDHPEILKIRDQFETAKQEQQRVVLKRQKDLELVEQERISKEKESEEEEQLGELRLAEIENQNAEKMRQEEEVNRDREAERLRQEQLQQEEIENARIAEIKKQAEAKRIKNEELQRKQQAKKLAEQQRTKEEEIRKQAEQKKARVAEQRRLAEIEKQKKIEEKQRQEELEKQRALATPVGISVEVEGVDKKFKRYGLLASSLKEAAVQQLQTAGFNVISTAEAKNKEDAVVLRLKFKYIERNYGGAELYTYSASTRVFPASSDRGEALWKQGVDSMANTLELGKVNKDFARNVEKFIHDHPRKGLEFKK